MLSAQNSNSERNLKYLLHIGFLLSGIATVLIGQVLPFLSARLNLNDRQAGNFFIAQFSGSLIGTFLTSWFGKKNKFVLASLLGCILMGIGILMLNFSSFELCFAGFFVNGLGIGLTLPSINMLIFELSPLNSTSALNFLNFFWGIGAIISQPFVDFLTRGNDIFTPTVILTVLFLLIGGGLFFIPSNIEKNPVQTQENSEDVSVPIWSNPIAWMIALFNFVHVGFESGMGGWLKTYTERVDANALENLIQPISVYFLFFVIGRGVAPVFSRFLDENKMLFLSLIVILFGMIILLFAKDLLILSVGAAIAGFGTSSVFPTNISRFTKFFGASASRRATPLFICGTLGATFTTWIIGFISNFYENDLRSGMFVMLGSVIFLIALQLFLSLQKRRT